MAPYTAVTDAPLAGVHGDKMAYPGEPVSDAGPLFDHLLEDA